MNNLFRLSTAAFAVAIATMSGANAQYDEVPLEEHPAYNPNEELSTFDLIMEPYPIPVKTTTYVNFFFNLPEELPDHFHAVFGGVINSQPKHLHHFVLTGCPNKVDPSEEGQPFEEDLVGLVSETTNLECIIPLGGWAPGSSVFGVTDIETGILMGRGMGIQAVQMNVHYTDGVYEDPEALTPKMAMDGIRVHYTPNFRPYSSAMVPLISIGAGPGRLAIPPGESRFYVTRTCKVVGNCQDTTNEQIEQMLLFSSFIGVNEEEIDAFTGGRDMSCATVKPLCNMPGEIGSQIKQLCPATCGLCEESSPDKVNPFTPESYRLSALGYHAHLLGREMYTTLLREENKIEAGEDIVSDTTVANEREVPTPTMTTIDIESRPFWIFDFQETIPLKSDIVKENDSVMQGIEVKPGDKIQATCVYDSTYRNETTQFERSTYDEMCITNSYVTFKTPDSLLTGSDGLVDINTELHLLSFGCLEDEETDVYTGTLTEDEDGRNIWKDHPIADAEGCTFPNVRVMGVSTLSFQTRNCPMEDPFMCGDLEMAQDAIAGASCTGGTYNEQDANTGTTKEQCEEGGGVYSPYNCFDIDWWLVNEAEKAGMDSSTVAFIVDNWYKPKCCFSDDDSSSNSEVEEQKEEDTEDEGGNEESMKENSDSDAIISSASKFIGSSSFLALLSTIVAMAL